MAVKTELSQAEREVVEQYKPVVDKVAYETYLRRVTCGCMSCMQFLDRVTDTQVGEMHVLIMHGNGNGASK